MHDTLEVLGTYGSFIYTNVFPFFNSVLKWQSIDELRKFQLVPTVYSGKNWPFHYTTEDKINTPGV